MSAQRQAKVANYRANKINGVEILIDNVYDPHNVAAVARSADGLGIAVINLYYTYNFAPNMQETGKKSSSSANKWICFNKINDLSAFIQEKKKQGYVFIGMDNRKGAEKLFRFIFPEKCIIILGSEHQGISSELQAACDQFVFIPMVGMVDSYNISVAAAIIMYEIFCQRGAALQLRSNV